MPAMKRPPARLSHLTLAKMIGCLIAKPCDASAIQRHTGLNRDTIYRFTTALRNEGAMHISDWKKDRLGRDSMPIFRLGRGVDVPRKRAR